MIGIHLYSIRVNRSSDGLSHDVTTAQAHCDGYPIGGGEHLCRILFI
jgi:hypothetical protein